MVLPPYDAEVISCGIVSSLGAVHMDRTGFLQVLLVPFPQGPRCFPYVLFITCNFLTLVCVNSSTLLVRGTCSGSISDSVSRVVIDSGVLKNSVKDSCSGDVGILPTLSTTCAMICFKLLLH